MYIVYSCDSEVIVTTVKDEKKAIKLWFTDGGRDLEEYDRSECKEVGVEIRPRLKVW